VFKTVIDPLMVGWVIREQFDGKNDPKTAATSGQRKNGI
jgi:hypothetical protein